MFTQLLVCYFMYFIQVIYIVSYSILSIYYITIKLTSILYNKEMY
jgi:hypothetical protein